MRVVVSESIGTNRTAHNGCGVVKNINKGGSQPRRETPINNQKKIGFKFFIMALMVSQPFAFMANMVLNVTTQPTYQLDWNEIIKGVISAIVSVLGTYFYHKYNNRHNGKN